MSMKRWIGDDPEFKWPVDDHYAILMSKNRMIDKELVLDILRGLHKQNERAKELSAEVRTLRKKCDSLEKENKFLTEQLNEE